MTIKEHDFVEIEYTGRLDDGTVFDTTSEEVAKKEKIHNPKGSYKSAIICVGETQVVKGLDEALVGKELGKTYTISLTPEKAFGRKDAKKIRLVPLSTFIKQQVMPQPGLQVNIDGQIATVMRVGGGRIMVDFNHPLASKNVSYELTIKRKVIDSKEQIESYISMIMPIKAKVEVTSESAEITMPGELPEPFVAELSKKLALLTGLKEVNFKKEEQKAQEEKKAPKT